MHKRIRIVVPAVQTLAFVAVWLLKRAALTSDAVNFNYYIPAESLVTRLNYPLMECWWILDYVLYRLHLPNPDSGVVFLALVLVVGFVFLSSVALFWYLVVREIELRIQRKSLLKFTGTIRPMLASAVLFCTGVGALVSACKDARAQHPLMLRNGSALGLLLTVLPEVFLLVWATVLIAMSVSDFRSLMADR